MSRDTMEKLNAVCLYLGALTLADICNENGTHIKTWALTGSKQAKVLLPWPNQGKPSEHCWVVWRRFLKKCFVPFTARLYRLNKPIQLQCPLGKWIIEQPYTARKYHFDPVSRDAFLLNSNQFQVFTPISNHVIWFQDTRYIVNKLPLSAIISSATIYFV
jgi:hypothetical protein